MTSRLFSASILPDLAFSGRHKGRIHQRIPFASVDFGRADVKRIAFSRIPRNQHIWDALNNPSSIRWRVDDYIYVTTASEFGLYLEYHKPQMCDREPARRAASTSF